MHACIVFIYNFGMSVAFRYHCWHYGIFTRLGIPGPKPIPVLGTLVPLIKDVRRHSLGVLVYYLFIR